MQKTGKNQVFIGEKAEKMSIYTKKRPFNI